MDYLKEYVPFNHLGEFIMELNPNDIVSKGNSIRPTLEKLLREDITMNKNKPSQLGFSFLSYYEIKDGHCYIGLTARCVRWVLGINRDNLFSTFHIGSFIKLSTSYAMDVYLYISGHYNMPQWQESIVDLKKRFALPEDANNKNFFDRILAASKRELIRQQSLLAFDYNPIKEVNFFKKGRKAYAKVEFVLYELKNGEYIPVKKK